MWYNIIIMPFEMYALDILKDKLVFKILNINMLLYFNILFLPEMSVYDVRTPLFACYELLLNTLP